MSLTNAQWFSDVFRKADGTAYAGCRLFHYEAGTLTAKTAWTDAAKTTAAAQPIVGDSTGRVSGYFDGTYRFIIKSSVADGDLTLYDFDDLEFHHPTATLRDENQALSLPSASAARRGTLFAVVDANGDVTTLSILKTASDWDNILFGNTDPEETIVFSKGANLTAGTTLNLGTDGNYFEVDGAGGPIDMISSKPAGTPILLRMNSTPAFTHNATSLILAMGVSYTAVAGDLFLIVSEGSSQWREVARNTRNAASGGTGFSSYAAGDLLYASGTIALSKLAAGGADAVLQHNGTAPFWGRGLLFHGPTSVGASSTRTHEGSVTTAGSGAGDANVSGVHFYTDLTLAAGDTYTVPAGERSIVLIARDSITINGTIDASGAGGTAGTAAGAAAGGTGGDGTDQAGGGGGGGNARVGGTGGALLHHGVTIQAGGAGGAINANGTAATQITGSEIALHMLARGWSGGAGGGGGGAQNGTAGGAGGAGGGTIVLIAPIITLAATATLNTSGVTGSNQAGAGAGGGGGGGAGNIYMICRSYTDNGATFTQTGGSGGTGIGNGAAGAAGVRQILIDS